MMRARARRADSWDRKDLPGLSRVFSPSKQGFIRYLLPVGGVPLFFGALWLGRGGSWWALAPILVFLLLAGVLVAHLYSKTRVRVAADGVVVRWLGWTQRVAFSQIEAVSLFDKTLFQEEIFGVRLRLRDGRELCVPCGLERAGEVAANDLLETLRSAIDAYKDGSGDGASALARGARSLSEWVAHLRVMGTQANVDMRTAPVNPDELLRVAEDPSAPPTTRVAAAIALKDDAAARVRLSAAASATASPALAEALERAASEASDEALIEALEALEALEAEGAADRRG
ncbi:MAG: hypothetical protein U0271_44955 [Polyangiaceae bacterium]